MGSFQSSQFFFFSTGNHRPVATKKKAQQINWPLFYPHYWNRYYWDILGYNHWYMKFIEVYWFLVDKCRYAYSTLEWFPSAWWMFQCFFPQKNTGKARQAPSKSWSKLVPLVFFMWCFLAYFWTVLGFFPNNSGLKWTKPPNGLVWKWGVASDMSKLIYSMLIKSDKHQQDKWRFRIFFCIFRKKKNKSTDQHKFPDHWPCQSCPTDVSNDCATTQTPHSLRGGPGGMWFLFFSEAIVIPKLPKRPATISTNMALACSLDSGG